MPGTTKNAPKLSVASAAPEMPSIYLQPQHQTSLKSSGTTINFQGTKDSMQTLANATQ